MNTRIQRFIETLRKKPKQIFLIDGFGALLTMFFLAVVLVTFQKYIGMPRTVLYFLSTIAFAFAVYSVSCYFIHLTNWRFLLKIIAFANLTYCFLTIGFVYYHFQNLTTLGLLYFFLELLIILGLVAIELMVILNQKKNNL
ncbi:hypothetical protein [uncultured Aquimarina sp.]|uniref:hypothetical protein n=1 Tax=uncultured Aquimarina sp. TaxID=575652 RepID=UPI00262B0B36|nr:hypothetical protein [uncultured Aquimarina sp.]